MEMLKNKIKLVPKLFIRSCLFVTFIFAMIACGGGQNNSNPNPNPIPNPLGTPSGFGTLGIVNLGNCPSCNASMMPARAVDLFDAKNGNGQVVFSRMQLIVNSANFMPGISSIYNLYSGPVAIQGQMIVNTMLTDPAGSCRINPGTYFVQTINVGSISMGQLQLPEFISTVGNIQMRILQGMLYKDAATQTTRMFGSVFITNANGVPCSMSFSDTFN